MIIKNDNIATMFNVDNLLNRRIENQGRLIALTKQVNLSNCVKNPETCATE